MIIACFPACDSGLTRTLSSQTSTIARSDSFMEAHLPFPRLPIEIEIQITLPKMFSNEQYEQYVRNAI